MHRVSFAKFSFFSLVMTGVELQNKVKHFVTCYVAVPDNLSVNQLWQINNIVSAENNCWVRHGPQVTGLKCSCDKKREKKDHFPFYLQVLKVFA